MDSNILLYLKEFQNKQGIQFLFVCESGSRAHGTSSTYSDHDLKGIYISKANSNTVFRNTGGNCKGMKNKIDIEFVPLPKFLEEVEGDDCKYLRWVTSPFTYIDKIPNLRQIVEQSFNFPYLDISDRVRKDLEKCKEGKRPAKKLLNMVVDTLLLIYFKLTGNFPPLKIQQLLQYLSTRQDIFQHEDVLRELLQQIHILKKNGKGLQEIDAPEQIVNLSKKALDLPIVHPLKTKQEVRLGIKQIAKSCK